jgi:hypothetical protein
MGACTLRIASTRSTHRPPACTTTDPAALLGACLPRTHAEPRLEPLCPVGSGPSATEEEVEPVSSVQEFFEGLPSRVTPDRIEGMNNTYVFDIEGAGQWTVAIADGQIAVSEGAGEADTTFSATEESFQKIVAGEQNPTTAYMTGKLKIKGDMGAAMKLQKLF